MKSGFLVALSFLASMLFITSCNPQRDGDSPPPPGKTPFSQTDEFHQGAVVILLEIDETADPPILVTPDYAWLSYPDQEIVWVSDQPQDDIAIQFIGPSPPANPPGGKAGKLRFRPNWAKGQHTGRHLYRVRITRNGTEYVRNPPEVIVDF
ncbi:MAG TPA: hypothetical protein VM557_04260 [Thermoanaerobaculia bacterium]|nr:hypothetical protein [Thermoanaerobaculia bacterium]